MSDVEDEVEEVGEEEEEEEPRKIQISEEDQEQARRLMEQRRSQLGQIDDEEIREYMEARIEQRAKEEQEIAELRAKISERRVEREREEKKLEEMRKAEEEKRKHDEEERRHEKEEKERSAREERERKKAEAEDRMKNIGKRNFTITKKDGQVVNFGGQDTAPAVGGEIQKSKEQLEAEKKAILAQRVQPLSVEGMDEDALKAKAQELHAAWFKLEGEKYDLEQEYKRKQYDLMELTERARQVSKGKGRQRGMSIVQIDSSVDRLADTHPNAPPKIQLCSRYERHTDSRSYDERKCVFGKGDGDEAGAEGGAEAIAEEEE